MSAAEFIHYDQQYYPPMPCRVDRITIPDTPATTPHETLTSEIAYVPNAARRMGLLATDQWFDLTRFRLSTAPPPAKSIYDYDIPANRYRPYSYRLKNTRHLGRAHSAFLSVSLTADYRGEETAYPQLGDETKPERMIEDFVLHSLAWDQHVHSLDYLLVSRELTEGIAAGEVAPARQGKAQQDTIERLVSNTRNPYTTLPEGFIEYLHT